MIGEEKHKKKGEENSREKGEEKVKEKKNEKEKEKGENKGKEIGKWNGEENGAEALNDGKGTKSKGKKGMTIEGDEGKGGLQGKKEEVKQD